MRIFRIHPALSAVLGIALISAGAWWWWRQSPPTPKPARSPLSALATPPDWSLLDPYQHSITRGEFEVLLLTVFTTGDAWRQFIQIDDARARIATGAEPAAYYTLHFRNSAEQPLPHRFWRNAADLSPAPPGKPLDGVKIAIDPGHIGGRWAEVEERNLTVSGQPPVKEGDLTLAVAKLLKPRLEALGATVVLVRKDAEPLTPLRPADLEDEAAATLEANPESSVRKLAERLFYRTAEIRARADLVNSTLKPDLVLCLHFNADAWGSPANPLMVDRSHLHLLINGAYADSEIALADQRFAMIQKILQGIHPEETRIAASVAAAMAEATGLPPFRYPSGSVREIPGQPYVYARNLLANRLYQCPVLFLEPYVMNSRTDYARIQAGDYDGTRDIAGKTRPSIFREYADSLTAGLVRHFTIHRPPPPR